MSLIVLLTGGFGFLSSFVLLQYGLGSMALRYPLALGVAYLFFLFLIWLWLRANVEDFLDAPTLPDGADWRPNVDVVPDFRGSGGQFGGGGASASFDGPSSTVADLADKPLAAVGKAAEAAGDADELVIPAIVVVFIVGLAVAMLYVVYIAPVLFAEVLVDGVLSYALFRRLRREEQRHWLTSAVRRTALPFVLTALFVAAAGAGMSAYAPGAESIGEVVHARR